MAEVKQLIEGYKKFYKDYFASGGELYSGLCEGQHPKTLIIACSDSRVDPSILTNAKPGDIFVVRNVANLVPPYQKKESGILGVSAAMEFAVRFLEVKHIVILGHSGCGGIRALIEGIEDSDFIGKWVSVAQPAKEKAAKRDGDMQQNCEEESVINSLANLTTFPWIKEKIESGNLKIHGWRFSLEDGSLNQYNPKTEKFEAIEVE